MIDVEKFIRDGWVIVDIPSYPNYDFINDIEDSLKIKSGYGGLCRMHYLAGDESIKERHIKLSEFFWEKEYGLKIANGLLPIIRQFLGLDIMVQYMPYLRIARPNKPEDNIGYHKDTQYGQTPYELAVHIPFVDLDEKSAIRVISGSHLMPENAFTRVTADGKPIEKGSIENRIGKPYMPKCLKVPEGMETTPLVMKVGQAAIFSPAIFHGQEVNEGDVTRVSCDLRFVSALKPNLKLGKIHAGYVPVAGSPVEVMAARYYEAQK